MLRKVSYRFLLAGIITSAPLALAACGPNYQLIDNRLREQNEKQARTISDLQDKLYERDSAIKQLQGELDHQLPRVENLPAARLAELFIAAKVEIRPQTDSWQLDDSKTLTGFRVFFRTLTDDGQNIPATGNVMIEAFQLSPAPKPPVRIGTWKFTAAEMKKNWYGFLGLNQFACNCPWEKPPTSPEIFFRLTFTDALTGHILEAHLEKKVTLNLAPGK